MEITPADLGTLAQLFRELADDICDHWEGNDEPSPLLLRKAVLQLFMVLDRNNPVEYNAARETLLPEEVNELGDYGIKLLQEMSAFAADLGLHQTAENMEDLAWPFAVWLSRQDCEINTLEPVVNALARKANTLGENQLLKQLFGQANEIIEAINPQISQDIESSNPMRPWRILIINRAIIATRSHDTELMTRAFDALIDILPSDAPQFFEEGVEQMDLLNYPEHVKQLMQQYFLLHNANHILH
ncbi:MAG: hypothetical protein PVG66_15645 [Chromatiales bacterium]|jgi:hypothetical protein